MGSFWYDHNLHILALFQWGRQAPHRLSRLSDTIAYQAKTSTWLCCTSEKAKGFTQASKHSNSENGSAFVLLSGYRIVSLWCHRPRYLMFGVRLMEGWQHTQMQQFPVGQTCKSASTGQTALTSCNSTQACVAYCKLSSTISLVC